VTGSCQVDFYLLGSPGQEAPRLACKLALMAWERGHDIAVVTGGDTEAAALDELMWQYPEGRFLPHERCGPDEASPAPVRILCSFPEHQSDVVINLSSRPLPEPRSCKRLLEIVPHHSEEREASRRKYQAYRALGIEPSTHEIGAEASP
jgi:DNA polymerase-3 subunit chi